MFWMPAFAGMTPVRLYKFIKLRPSEKSKNRIPYDVSRKICNCIIHYEMGAGKGAGPTLETGMHQASGKQGSNRVFGEHKHASGS